MTEKEKIPSDCLESHALGPSVPESGLGAIHPKLSELCVGPETAIQQLLADGFILKGIELDPSLWSPWTTKRPEQPLFQAPPKISKTT